MTAKEIASILAAADKSSIRRAALADFQVPFPTPALKLMIWRESRWNDECIHKNAGGFYEIGTTQRTVAFKDGGGTAKSANVNPFDLYSSVYGAQVEYQGAITRWLSTLPDLKLTVPKFSEVGSWIILMHAPYSMGWTVVKRLLVAGRAASVTQHPVTTLRACLRLSDDELPDPGPQTDEKIRKRINRLLAYPDDAREIGALPPVICGFPHRTELVQAMPRWRSVVSRAEKILARRSP